VSGYSRQYSVYILTNPWLTLYVGVTNDLTRRVWSIGRKLVPGFTARCGITRLVYFEMTDSIEAAIAREEQIKGWLRAKKVALVESVNPAWRDLAEDMIDR
jgi:putative endonuclease